jgi:hypothetical protein
MAAVLMEYVATLSEGDVVAAEERRAQIKHFVSG